ncbi:MAG: AAA family ATPase [Candidatus Saccharibacteria bacterium]|nr:AAA family ATPase [Candidatus Saccharibacteria bacterium]
MNEISQIKELIAQNKSFVLSGGPGSGKTHTLIETLKHIYTVNPIASVACITFTNAAVDEIRGRYKPPSGSLLTLTIHDFLWSSISNFQTDLKRALVSLLAENSRYFQYDGSMVIDEEYLKTENITYREQHNFERGVVSHDQVIPLARKMFENHSLLADIVNDRYRYILVDEYQDTFDDALVILLQYLKTSKKRGVIGLFGDEMQAIYENSASANREQLIKESCELISKEDNRRNPAQVIALINKFRSDGLEQIASIEESSPNYRKEGSIKFIYSTVSYSIKDIKKLQFFDTWDFGNSTATKELYLTKKLIAEESGFAGLMDIYTNDQIIKYKSLVSKRIKEDNVEIDENERFGKIIERMGLPQDKKTKDFISKNEDLYEFAKNLPYKSISGTYLKADQLIGRKKKQQIQLSQTGDDRDDLINHLLDIQECIYLYSGKQYNKFIQKTDYKVGCIADKETLRASIESMRHMEEGVISAVIEAANRMGIWQKGSAIKSFLQTNPYTYYRVGPVKYKELIALYNYIEDYTPYSTQHNIKGTEYDNVFIVLDNGNWNKYNFQSLFENSSSNQEALQRTTRLFYVCCSRAKNELVVYFNRPTQGVINGAKELFGEENILCIDSFVAAS